MGSLLIVFYEPVLTIFGFLSNLFASLMIAFSDYLVADGETSEQIQRGSLALITVTSFYVLLIRILHRNLPLTVLATRLRYVFESDTGNSVLIERTQVYRANESHVAAHYLSLHATNGGQVPEINSGDSCRLPDAYPKDKFTCSGTKSNGWSCIQTFDPALPYSIWARMLVPNWALILLLRFHIVDIDQPAPFFLRFASVRRLISHEKDEYKIENPYIEIAAVRYVTNNFWLELHFRDYEIEDVSAHRLTSSGLTPIAVHGPTSERDYYSIVISKLSNEKAQIRWRNLTPNNTSV